jgi:hypothetical protein
MRLRETMGAKSFAWFSAKTLTVVIEDCQGDVMEIVIDARWDCNDLTIILNGLLVGFKRSGFYLLL